MQQDIGCYMKRCLNEKISVFAPKIKSPLANITVVHGSDWTKGALMRQLGDILGDQEKLKDVTVRTLLGDEFDISKLPDRKEHFFNSQILEEAVQLITGIIQKYDHKRVLIITYKDLKPLLSRYFEGSAVDIAWDSFGATRGTNRYKEYEAVILLGAFRVPYSVLWRKINVWANLLGITDQIPQETVIKPRRYDGTNEGHGYRTFDHWFADALVNQWEEGELIQSAERIRPHMGGRKHVYVLASRPALPYTTSLLAKSELIEEFVGSKKDEVKAYLEEYYKKHQKFPTYRSVAEQFGVSNQTIKQFRKEIEAS